MHIDKKVLKGLAKVAEDPEKKLYAEYVMLVLAGEKKSQALKAIFPERYNSAVERANGNQMVVNANVTKAVRHLERGKLVQELYAQSHKHWWIEFIGKKHKLYENLYGMALDEGVIPRDRIAASKVMLEHMPAFQEDIKVVHEVKEDKAAFVNKLREMQLALHKQANAEEIEAVIVEEAINVEPS